MSMRDQLFSAGIINKKELRKSKLAAKKARKQKQGTRQKKSVLAAEEKALQAAENKARIEKKRQERVARDAEKDALTRQKQVRQLLTHHQIRSYQGQSPFYHLSATRRHVHKLYVKGSIEVDLQCGDLAICHMGDEETTYVIVPARVARKIQSLAPDLVLLFNGRVDTEKEAK